MGESTKKIAMDYLIAALSIIPDQSALSPEELEEKLTQIERDYPLVEIYRHEDGTATFGMREWTIQ